MPSPVPCPTMPEAVPPRELAMYVAGQPDLTGFGAGSSRFSFGGRLASMFVPGAGLAYTTRVSPPAPSGTAADSGPQPEADPAADPAYSDLALPTRQSLAIVLDYAQKFGWSVHIIDVTRQLVPESEILASLGGDVTLPILVRPDGGRLQGEEQFTPGRIRRFLAAP